MKAWMSLNFGQIRSRTAELASLERLRKFPIDLQWQKMCKRLHFAWIAFIFAGNNDMYKSLDEFEFQSDPMND